MPLYKTENGYFRDVKKWLAYVLIREDGEKNFFLYDYNQERSKVFYSSFKHPLPSFAFKKHTKIFFEEKSTADFSTLFFFLQFTTNQKEKINRFYSNAYLYPIDCSYEDFSNYSLKNHTFNPQHLDSVFKEEKNSKKKLFLINSNMLLKFQTQK